MEFYKVNVDEEEEISQEVGIKSMPTIVVFKNGQKMNEVFGADFNGIQALVSSSASLVDPV